MRWNGSTLLASIALTVMACKYPGKHRDSETSWRGIDRSSATCEGDGKLFLLPRITCVARSVIYMCLLNRTGEMYDCAPDGTPAKAER